MSQSLTIPGLTGSIAAIGYGHPDRPKILALHGWLDNAATFQPLAEQMEDFYIVAMDFAGHGLSERRAKGSVYHLSDYVCDVAHVVNALEWDSFSLMGHSLGAGVSILYAALYPGLVSQLIMIDGLGPITANADSAIERMRRAVNATLTAKPENERSAKIYTDWDKLVSARTLASPLYDDSAKTLLERGTTEVDVGFTVNADPRLKHPSPIYMAEEVVLEFISHIECPALLVLAENGMVMRRSATPSRIEKFRNLKVMQLPGQHHLHMDSPIPVSDAISEFLRTQEA
ncbi:MAG: alpha/beta hydrolase [Acidiferrobacterales bacterium]|nr:alpha/beta hydrolase [Acidiferrobacterales bacterium]